MFKPYLKVIVFFVFVLTTSLVYGQGTSNKGKDFWVAYQSVSDDLNSRLTLFLTSNSDAVVNISAGGQILAPVNILAGQAIPVVINPNTYTNSYISVSDAIQVNSGIHITSDVDIIVYCHISIQSRSASSLILPVKALGNEYYSISYTQSASTNTREAVSEFSLIGVVDGTVIDILPTKSSLGNTRIANIPFRITLNKGDVYQYKSTQDLTGSKIKTVGDCKPLAVFSGSTFNAYCEPGNNRNAGSGDPLYQQLFPTSAWGRNFITAPFYNAQNGSSDIIRIQVAKDNTVISVNGSTTSVLGVPLNNPYTAGSVITFGAKIPTIINADAPISVAQLQVTQACNINGTQFPGDPELTILNPIEQTLKDITVFSAVKNLTNPPTAITSHYLNIILKTADIPTLTVDGLAPTANYQQIDNTYSFITIDVTASSNVNPAHRIRCDNGFVAIAYGYGSVESYAYLAGSDLKNLNAGIEFFPVGGTMEASSLCLGEDYNVKLKLPYKTDQIVWDFNNGAKKETLLNPNYTEETVDGKTSYYYDYKILSGDLQHTGNYAFKATVLNPDPSGCDANEDVVGDFEVFNLPTAKFSADKQQICGSDLVTFTDKSEGKGKRIVKWFWDFGDGSAIEQRTDALPFTHQYVSPGDYNVKLYVIGETDCVSNVNDNLIIHVAKSPEAKFSQDPVNCVSQAINFTDLSVPDEGTITSWAWDFGDVTSISNISTDNNSSHTFDKTGIYNVKLTVTTDLGCSNTVTQVVTIHPLPIVDFETPDICLNDASALFTNKSTIADGSTLTYVWDFGDSNASATNNTSTLQNPSHSYTEAKVYQVKLTATSANGCVTTLTKSFTVNGSVPKASFTVQNKAQLCSDQEVVFEDHATVDFGEITKIEWYFDIDNHPNDPLYKFIDNNPASRLERQNGPRLYKYLYGLGNKSVKVLMKVFSGVSCVSEITQVINLKAVPDVLFSTLPNVCAEVAPFAFTQASETTGISGVGKYSGAGINVDGVFSPAKAGVGTHSITYTFVADNGCSGTATQNVTVLATPHVDAGSDKTVLTGGEVVLDATASGENLTYKWIPSTDLSQDNILNPVASPKKSTVYTLLTTSDEGCTLADDVAVMVLQFPEIPNTFTPNGDGVNDTWAIKYLDSYPSCTIKIFNRYGKVVFESQKYIPWDGKLNGDYLPEGMYYYIITAKDGELKYTGSLLLVK
ncbi:T9SS C-terminal target domain-containing protein [Pedobacter arcticus]|uniref:T9SS C-terminal target domain-containing protein n=1 Tax=Pedobacter arcticus TaxID=752140 RepID=UPI00030F6DDB|nr:T9SS C-terminal target domain-containing protein [Pedobacter arcticus]